MPTYEVTYRTTFKLVRKKRTVTKTIKVQAIGETHLRTQMEEYGRKVGKWVEVVFWREV